MLETIKTAAPPFIGIIGMPAAQRDDEERKSDASGLPSTRLENWKIKSAQHELLMKWSNVDGLSARSIQIGFACIIERCLASDLEEFVVEDIVPGFTLGTDDPSIVLEAEVKIANIFQVAAASHFRKTPEFRLGLRHGEFDLRFYMGRTLPSDSVMHEDGFLLDEY